MTWPAIVLWILIAIATFSRGPMMIYLFSASVIFGSLTMLPPAVAGGLNVPAQTICAAILIFKTLTRPGKFDAAMRLAFDARRLGLLTLFWMYAILTAVMFPRLFAGSFQVIDLSTSQLGPLRPTATNFTQAVYISISIALLFAFAIGARNAAFRRHILQSILLAGVLLIASGLIDLTLSSAGLSDLLAPFRNANYALLTDSDIAGQKRVVGFMAEASAYGPPCIATAAILFFCQNGFGPALRRHVVPTTVFGLVIMAFLSTSSTGYAGIIVMAALILGRAVMIAFFIKADPAAKTRSATILFGTLIAVFVLVEIIPGSITGPYFRLIDILLFQKTDSLSYIDRSHLTQVGIATVWASHGIGAGIGSLRTSNWYVNILASTGFFGVALLAVSLLNIALSRPRVTDRTSHSLRTGLLLSLLPPAVMIGLAGTTPDPGVFVMSIFGLLASTSFVTLSNTSGSKTRPIPLTHFLELPN
jgi:hypothetical protein